MGSINLSLLALSLFISVALAAENLPGPKLTLSQGLIQGSTGISRNGRPFYQFLGIPYGKVAKRFGRSEKADGWTGTKDVSKFQTFCLQYNFLLDKVDGQEDCLVLNVYTPNMNFTTSDLPVMVFIHGGGFVLGSAGEFGGSYLMNKDVVYVAINYRLGALGFLNAGLEGASGNQGMKDQVLALKWIQDNIAAFGGDKNKVNIFGQSAGGGSVSLLTLSPMAKGLFHTAISQSGTALCPFVMRRNQPEVETKKLANLLDCPTSDTKYMIECLRRINGIELVLATKPKYPQHLYFDVYDTPQFGPSVETYTGVENDTNTFLSQDPHTILEDGSFNPVPWIVGVNEQEGIVVLAAPVLYNDTLNELINEEWGRVAPSTFLYHYSARDPCSVSSKIRQFYFPNNQSIDKANANAQALVDLYSDRFFLQCTKQTATLYAKHAPVYLYFFDHKVQNSASGLVGWPNSEGLKAPSHADDLQYFFDFPIIPYSPGIPRGNSEEQFSEQLIDLWVSFAKEGKPTALWGETKEWPRLDPSEKPLKWMHIDNELKLQPEFSKFTQKMEFWDEIVQNFRK